MSENSTFSTNSLNQWYSALRDGRDSAVKRLWQLYFARMVKVARQKLSGANRVARDEEDIALSAFNSFCMGFQRGQFAADGKPETLWPLLVTLTINKSIDYLRKQNRAKRGGSLESGRSSIRAQPDQLHEFISMEPTPDLQVAMQDAFDSLLNALDKTADASLRQIVLLAIEGHRPPQIAAALQNCSVRTIQRKLKTIRSVWESVCHESR